MVRASALLDGITAPVDRGFSNQERMNCISSSRRRFFFSTRTTVCDGIATGSRVRGGGFRRELHGYRARSEGSRWLVGMAAPISQSVDKFFDSTEESGRFGLGFFRRQLVELRQQLALAFG